MKKIIEKHKTLSSGVIIALVGAAQMGLPQLQSVLGEKAFAIVTFTLGLLVAGIGAWNTYKTNRDEAIARALAEAPDTTDEAGA